MTSFQDAPDEAIEADEAKEVRSTTTNQLFFLDNFALYLTILGVFRY